MINQENTNIPASELQDLGYISVEETITTSLTKYWLRALKDTVGIISNLLHSLKLSSASRHPPLSFNLYYISADDLHCGSTQLTRQSIPQTLQPPTAIELLPLARSPSLHDCTQRYHQSAIPLSVDFGRRPLLRFDSYPIRRFRYNHFNLSLL